LFLLAYAGYTLYQKYSVSQFWLRMLVDSGSIHLLIGVLVGPHMLMLLTLDILDQLNFLVTLVLGWAGFLIGLQVKGSELKRFQKGYYLFASTYFFINSLIFFILLVIAIQLSKGQYNLSDGAFLVVLGAVSSPILIGIIKSQLKMRGPAIHLMQFSVALDNVFAVFFLGLLMILINPYFGFDIHSFLIIAGAILFSSIIAYLFYKLSKPIKDEQQYFLLLIGFLLVTVGVSMNLSVSMLFMAFVFGVVLTNLPLDTRKLYHSISSAEKPLYYLLVIFVGATISNISLMYIFLATGFILIRFIGKVLSGYISRRVVIQREHIPLQSGLAHIGMGGVAMAMVLDYHMATGNNVSGFFVFLTAFSVIGNVIISAFLIKRIK